MAHERIQPRVSWPRPATPAEMRPIWHGEFQDFDDWVSKAVTRLTGTYHPLTGAEVAAVCVDDIGRRCTCGADFMRARDEGAFPVRFFWEMERVEAGRDERQIDLKLQQQAPAAEDVNLVTLRGTVQTGEHNPHDTGQFKVVRMTVVTTRTYWKEGEQRTASEFHKVVIFDQACVQAAWHVRKGDRVEIQGEVQTRQYNVPADARQPAHTRRVTEIVLQPGRGKLTRLDRAPQEESEPDEPAQP